MGNKVCLVLTVCFLILACQYLEAVVKQGFYNHSLKMLTWEKARLYCQNNYVDLISMQTLNMTALWFSKQSELLPLWVGLVRHPEDATVWKEVSFKTGGLSEDNVSQSIRWDHGKIEPLCAYVNTNKLWHSDLCSTEKFFYCSLSDRIIYHKIAKSWDKASEYCQNMSGHLVNMDDTSANIFKLPGWIGAYQRNYIWSWVGNFTPALTRWAKNEPQSQDCASYNVSTKNYIRASCSKKLHPLCLNDNLLVVKENKTWEEALNHCLKLSVCKTGTLQCNHKYNLLSLDEQSDYNYIRDRIYRATTTEVWIGLCFLGGSWWWVDGQKLEEKWMLPSCPSERNRCGTLSKYGTSKWIVRDCTKKLNFICYWK